MDNTLKIWKYLVPVLKNSTELQNIVPAEHINPLSFNIEAVKFPWVIYKRDSLVPTYTKHYPGVGGWVNNITLSITVYSDNYDEALDAANIIRDLLENYSYRSEEIKIDAIELINTYELVESDIFEQVLIFSVTAT